MVLFGFIGTYLDTISNENRLQGCLFQADGFLIKYYRGIYGLSCNLWVIVVFVCKSDFCFF